jgi:hypothetical protein
MEKEKESNKEPYGRMSPGMEFLMTYGWAILVVIAAFAALIYFGVLDPAIWKREAVEPLLQWAENVTQNITP